MTATRRGAVLSALQADRIGALRAARADGSRPPFQPVCPLAVAEIAERLDPRRLGRALDIAARANGALQAAITADGGSQGGTEAVPDLYELQLPGDFAWTDPVRVADLADRLARHEFAWGQPMADVGWAIDGNRTMLVLRADQLICDLRAIQLFGEALSSAYRNSVAQSPPDYFGLVNREEDWLAGREGQAERDRWVAALAGAELPLLPPPGLPVASDRAAVPDSARSPRRLGFTLGSAATRGLGTLCRGAHVTVSTALLVCLASELARYSGSAGLVIPLRFARRERPEVADVIMWRDAHLPVIVPVSGDKTLSEVLRATQRSSFYALAHQRVGWPTIARSIAAWGEPDPLTRSVSLHYLPAQLLAHPDGKSFAGARAVMRPGPPCSSGAVIDLVAVQEPARIRVTAIYDPARIGDDRVHGIVAGLKRAVGNLLQAYQRGADMPFAALDSSAANGTPV